MAEPENHTIRLLQDMREEMRRGFAAFETKFTRLESKVDSGFEHLVDEIEDLRKVMAGETVLGRMAAKNVDDRLSSLERRMEAVEGKS